MRDIDWWCLIETSLHVNERYVMPYWVCMLMRDIDCWCLIETCLYVNERYRLMMSYWTMFAWNERYRLMMS